MLEIIETELTQISKGFAIMGGFIVIYGLVSYVVKERLYLSEPLLAMTLGYVPHLTQHHCRTPCAELGQPLRVGRRRDVQ